MIKTKILNPSLETIGEEIGRNLGEKMVKDFQDNYPNEVSAYYIGRNIIDQILSQPGCVGIKYYMGLNEVGEKTLVYVGINEKNQIIDEYQVIDNSGKLIPLKGIVGDRSNGTGGKGTASTVETTISINSWT